MARSKGIVVGFWIVTALFCLQIGFTAYAQLYLPQVAEAFTHLGFPHYFRVEFAWAKLFGVMLLLAPVPARFKEWAYAGFAINLGSALIAHLSVGDGPAAWSWSVGTGVLWGLSYFFWRRLQAALTFRSDFSGTVAVTPSIKACAAANPAIARRERDDKLSVRLT